MSVSPLQSQLLNYTNNPLSIQTNDCSQQHQHILPPIGGYKTTSPLNHLLNTSPINQLKRDEELCSTTSSSSSSMSSSSNSSVKDEQISPLLQQQQQPQQHRGLNPLSTATIDLSSVPNKCDLCKELILNNSKVLYGCYHIFCMSCLERLQQSCSSPNTSGINRIICPFCQQEIRILDAASTTSNNNSCTQEMLDEFTGGHGLVAHDLSGMNLGGGALAVGEQHNGNKVCLKHNGEQMKYFCSTCNQLLCKECMQYEPHSATSLQKHEVGLISEIAVVQTKKLQQLLDTYKLQLQAILANDSNNNNLFNHQNHNVTQEHSLDQCVAFLNSRYQTAMQDIDNVYQFYKQLLDERKQEIKAELDNMYHAKQLLINNLLKGDDSLSQIKFKIETMIDYTQKLIKKTNGSNVSELLIAKKTIEQKIQILLQQLALATSDMNLNKYNKELFNIEFVTNYSGIQGSVMNTFGYLRSSVDMTSTNNSYYKPKPIGPPMTASLRHSNNSPKLNDLFNGIYNSSKNIMTSNTSTNGGGSHFTDMSAFEAWSNGTTTTQSSHHNNNSSDFNDLATLQAEHLLDLTTSSTASQTMRQTNSITTTVANIGQQNGTSNVSLHHTIGPSSSILPARSQLKRQKMIYNCKFGEFGINDGQFTEPSGVAINQLNDIIVADTNSHRIQIFDRDGHFKFKFGECGKREGQLLYPNRVSIVKQTGDIIVTERSPTHQIQIYNQYGHFIRKFGANILQHPRGVCVDSKGNIIVVECKVMRVIIFDQYGNVVQKFSCSKYLEFPNGVCVNDKQEIFISDNRAHCIKVFNYAGAFLRQIGGEGITNYPIGVGINTNGEVLVADNHNNFNLTVFTQDGQLINALESKVKHAQCFDVGLMDDGSIVLASKDYRIYVYRYISTQGSSPSLSSTNANANNNNNSSSTLGF